jgi:hypothetical protein
MSSATFGEVIADQYEPPQPWLELNLDRDFTHIEPRSALGFLIMEVCERFEIVGDFDSDLKRYIMLHMYESVNYAFGQHSGPVRTQDYEMFVNQAHEEMSEELEIPAILLKEQVAAEEDRAPVHAWSEIDEALEQIYNDVHDEVEHEEEPCEEEDDGMSLERSFASEVRDLLIQESDLHFGKPRRWAALQHVLRENRKDLSA